MTEEEKLKASRDQRRDLEAELKEERDRYDAQNQEAFDKEVSGENFLKDRAQKTDEEEDIDGGKLAQSIAFEASVGLATDAATAALGFAPPVYALANFVSGAVANAIAQKIRGESNLSIGEILASGGIGIIPGTTIKTGKQLSKVVGKAKTVKRAAIATGLSGVGSEAIRIGIDEQRLLNVQEALVGGTLGGVTGASLQKIVNASPALLKRFNDLLPERESPITVMAMSPQKATTPGNIQKLKGTAISPFTGRLVKQQKIGPYPSLPVNATVIKVDSIEDAKDFIISRTLNKKRKTIRSRGKQGPQIFEVTGGEQVMFDVDLRGDSYISRRDQLITVPAVDVAQNSRYVLEQIPEDLEYYIRNKYGDELFEQYARYVKAGRNRLNVIKQEMQDEIKAIRADVIDIEAGVVSRPGLITPTQQKLEDSHILSIGKRGRLVKTGLTPGIKKVLQTSKLASSTSPNITRNFPKESRVYEPPAAYQSFIEFWKDNRARSAGIAVEGRTLEEAVSELRELGLPTSWLEDFFNFAIFDNLIASELNNKDIIKLLKQGYSAEAVYQQRLQKLNREMQLLDVYDFQDSIRDLPVEIQIQKIDERYRNELLSGTNISTFLNPPDKVPGTE